MVNKTKMEVVMLNLSEKKILYSCKSIRIIGSKVEVLSNDNRTIILNIPSAEIYTLKEHYFHKIMN